MGIPASAQTTLADLANSMQPGQWAELTTSNIGPALKYDSGSGVHNILPYANAAVWDSVTGCVYYIGSDHSYTPDALRFVKFCEDSNSWTVLPQPSYYVNTGGSYNDAHGYDKTTIAGRTLYRNRYNGSAIQPYNLDTGVWGAALPNYPWVPYSGCCDSIAYFPPMNSIIYITAGTAEVYRFNLATSQWSTIGTVGALGGSTWLFTEYNAHTQVLVFGKSGQNTNAWFQLSATGQITSIPSPSASMYDGSGASGNLTVDPANGDLLMIASNAGGRALHRYNGTDWALAANQPPFAGQNVSLVTTPITTYGVNLVTVCGNGGSGVCRVYLYKHSNIVVPPPQTNNPPVVNAGPNISVVLPSSGTLNGTCSDDGLPNGALACQWSGPSGVVFANPSAAVTTATFPAPGSYALTLTGNDGAISVSKTATATVGSTPAPLLTIPFDTTSQGSDGKFYRIQGTVTEQ